MAGLKERVGHRVDVLREERPLVDRAVRTFAYYSERDGNAQAGAVTFYAFVSFFPLLALAFFAVGYISAVYPDARRETIDAIDAVLPGLVGNGQGQIPIATIEHYAGRIGLLAVIGLLYSGLGWISAMRRALATMFRVPESDRLSFVRGKLRDLAALVVLGVVLVASVSLSGAMSWWSETILHALGLDRVRGTALLLWILTHVLAIGATALLLMAVYRLVPHTHVARRALWEGALTGAVGFEVLKALAGFLFTLTMQRPAFQAFGVALILVVWINYFSRLVMLSASWAYNAPSAEALRALEQQPLVPAEDGELVEPAPAAVVAEDAAERPEPSAAPGNRGGAADPARRRGGLVAALTRLRRPPHR